MVQVKARDESLPEAYTSYVSGSDEEAQRRDAPFIDGIIVAAALLPPVPDTSRPDPRS